MFVGIISISSIRLASFWSRNSHVTSTASTFGINAADFSSIEMVKRKYGIDQHSEMSLPEACCAISHVEVLRHFLKTDEQYALILEDDVTMKIRADEIEDIINFIGSQTGFPGLLHLGAVDGIKTRIFPKVVLMHGKNKIYFVSKFNLTWILRTAAYIVDRGAAKHLIELQSKKLERADNWFIHFRNARLKCYFANLASHPVELTNSDIENQRTRAFNKKLSIKYIKFKILTLKNYLVMRLILGLSEIKIND